jgi:membrane-bound ClpP family serine protease
MLMWILILSLLLIGIALIIVEIIFIPGTTVVGLLGGVFTITGIIVSYKHFGTTTGHYVLGAVLISTALSIYLSFRSGAWNRFALHTTMAGKVNEGLIDFLKVGDEGVAVSALRPMGKVNFQDKIVEVKTVGSYLDQGNKVKVVNIQQTQITVEPII